MYKYPQNWSYRELPDVGTETKLGSSVLLTHRAIFLGPSDPHFKLFNLIWK